MDADWDGEEEGAVVVEAIGEWDDEKDGYEITLRNDLRKLVESRVKWREKGRRRARGGKKRGEMK